MPVISNIDVKDKKGQQTPLYLAIKANDEESVRLLIAQGANLDHKLFGKSLQNHIKQKMSHIDPESIPKLRAGLAKQTSQSTMEKLVSIIEDFQNNDDVNLFKSLLLEVDAHELNKFTSGGLTLLQKACDESKTDLVETLLDHGMNVDGKTEGSMMAPVLRSATKGDWKTMQVLLNHRADITVTKISTNETILHCLLQQNQNNDPDNLNALLNHQNEEVQTKIQSIINKKDINGQTALHIASEKWPSEAVRYILEAGANIGMKNQWSEVAITKILPETFETFLNEYCMNSNYPDTDVNRHDFEITFDYSFLAPTNENLPEALRKRTDPEDPAETKLVANQNRNPLPETDALWHMGQSKEHRHLLKHPVITSFLWLKWQRIRKTFNRNMRFYVLFVFILTWYIFEKFGGRTSGLSEDGLKDGTIPFFHGLFGFFAFIMLVSILKDFKEDVRDVIRKNKQDDENQGVGCGQIVAICLSNWIEVALLVGLFFILIFGEKLLLYALIVLTLMLIVREFFQLTVSLRRYIVSPENWIEVSVLVLTVMIVHPDTDVNTEDLKKHLSAIAIVLSWAEAITLIGKHPKLTRYNVYVHMFYKVMGTFFFFLIWFVLFIVAFGLGFYIMLHKDPGDVGEDEMVFFNKPWTALVKTSTMFVGELEFSDIPIDLNIGDTDQANHLAPLAYLFFLSFVFLIVVVLMNLLNGLAVSDTGIIQEKAEIVTYISQVETISYTESILLGDPFGYLSEWPAFKWLKNVPSFSCCAPLYRIKCCQVMFEKIAGATTILLFYSFLTDARFTLKPNESRNQCDWLSVRQMDESIISSAKKIILEQKFQNDHDNNDKIEKLEAKLRNMEQLMLSMNEKLTKLTNTAL